MTEDSLAIARQHAETLQGLVGSAPDHGQEAAVLGELARTEAVIAVAERQLAAAQPQMDGPPVVDPMLWQSLASSSADAAELLHEIGQRLGSVPSERVDELLAATAPMSADDRAAARQQRERARP